MGTVCRALIVLAWAAGIAACTGQAVEFAGPAVLVVQVDQDRGVGLTGTVEETSKVAHQFGAHFAKSTEQTAAGYLMSHTVSIFGVDPKGQTRLLIDYEASVDLVVKEIRALLAAA